MMHIRKFLTASAIAVAIATAPSFSYAKEIVVSAVSPTSDDYALSVVWSNLIAKLGGDLQLTVVDNGTVKGMRQLAKGQIQIATIGAPHYRDAINKSGKFKEDPDNLVAKYKDARALFAIRTAAGQYIVRADSGITGFSDFKGKSFAIGRPGGNGGRVTEALLAAHGVNLEKDTDGQYLRYAPAVEQMANGSMDGTLVWGGVPQAAVDNASRQMKIQFVSPDPARLGAFRKSITNGEYYVLKKVPAAVIQEAYGGRIADNGDQYHWTFPFMFVVDKAMDAETAYQLTRTLWDNLAEVNRTSHALSLIGMDGAVEALSADLHPGAARYFKEKGLIK